MAQFFHLILVLPVICVTSAAEESSTCDVAKEASNLMGQQGLLQVRSQVSPRRNQRHTQMSAHKLKDVSNARAVKNDPSGGQCPLPDGAQWCEVRLQNHPPYWMAARQANDILSWSVCSQGFWDHDDTAQFGTPGQALDIGTNIGYFSLMLAHAGWNVTSFEPMASNLAFLNASLCQNPALAARIKVVPFGLGPNPQECKMFAPANNIGDGHAQCGDDLASGFSGDPNNPAFIGFYNVQEIGSFSIRRLDQLLQENAVTNVDFIKIDVEGYESQVLASAPNLLSQYKPRLNKLEVWKDSFGFNGTHFLNQYEAAGYKFFDDALCKIPVDAQHSVLEKGLWEGFACEASGMP